ncbi:MAG: AAA family ATPase [Actinobacteria bacterium]|nr:AAA family ATPase [Actinomycetota bacterium]
MSEKNSSAVSALLEGSTIVQQGRADVLKVRRRTWIRRVLRGILVFGAVDGFLWYRYATRNPLELPSLPPEWPMFLPVVGLFFVILLMAALPLMNGRSPHITVYPEQVETGLTEVRGLDSQVEEVARSLDVFLGYATFRKELGGTPRRGILFEGPPGTGKTYLAKAMAKQAGVPFLFISAPAFQSMWQGMTAFRIRSFFKKLRKIARKEGGAIGFIEEIDAIGLARGAFGATPAPTDLARTTSLMLGSGDGAMVNELLIQMQSFDQPPLRERIRARLIGWINSYLPEGISLRAMRPSYSNILLIAATNRADNLDPALLRPGRFDRRLYFDLPTKQGRRDLIDFFMDRKAHHQELDAQGVREKISHETFGYTPVMIEHLMDEALLLALRDGRREMNLNDILEARLTEEVGIKQPVVYTDVDREAVASHEAGHATVAHFVGKGRRLEVLSIIKRRGSLGLLAHGDEEERFTRTRSEVEAGVAIALGGLVAEEMCFGESGTGPANDLATATDLAARMVGSFGMAAGGGHPGHPEGARARGARGEPGRALGPAGRPDRARRAGRRRDPPGHREDPREPPRVTARLIPPALDFDPWIPRRSSSTSWTSSTGSSARSRGPRCGRRGSFTARRRSWSAGRPARSTFTGAPERRTCTRACTTCSSAGWSAPGRPTTRRPAASSKRRPASPASSSVRSSGTCTAAGRRRAGPRSTGSSGTGRSERRPRRSTGAGS